MTPLIAAVDKNAPALARRAVVLTSLVSIAIW